MDLPNHLLVPSFVGYFDPVLGIQVFVDGGKVDFHGFFNAFLGLTRFKIFTLSVSSTCDSFFARIKRTFFVVDALTQVNFELRMQAYRVISDSVRNPFYLDFNPI